MALGKMRVLWYTGNAKMIKLGNKICNMYGINGESIPPAYNPEKEKLVFIGISAKKEAPDLLRRFLREINKSRAQNVAFFFDAPKPVAEMLMAQVTEAGAHVMEDVFYYEPGFTLPFMSSIKEEDLKRFTDWVTRQVELVSD